MTENQLHARIEAHVQSELLRLDLIDYIHGRGGNPLHVGSHREEEGYLVPDKP